MNWKWVIAAPAMCAAASALVAAQGAGPALSVSDLVELALRENREFLAAKQRVVETQGLLRQAGVRPAPAVQLEGSTGRPFGSPDEQVLSAGYFHTIETSGKREKRLDAAQQALAAAEAELADRVRLLALDIKVKYARALREQQKLQTIGRLSSTNRQYYTVTEARVRTGDAAPLEAQLFLSEVNRVDAQHVLLASGAERALLELQRIVGLDPDQPISLTVAAPPKSTVARLPELQTRALQDRPDLRALKALEEQALAEERLARAERTPDVTASARYSRVDSGFDQFGWTSGGTLAPIRSRDHMLTFGLSFFISPPARMQGAIDAAQARTSAAHLRTQHLEGVIRLEVDSAYRRWQAAARAADILTRGVMDQSERNLTVLRTAYSLGQLRILDVLNEQRRLIDTQLAYADAESELFEAFAELEASVGEALR
jgi:cobalt-zinc-cadmium efflux system outer membrane protein